MQNLEKLPHNLIFDLGGVLLNIDYLKTQKAFEHLGLIDFNRIYNQFDQNHWFEEFERGQIDAKVMIHHLESTSGIKLTMSTFKKAWNAMLLDLPIERIKLLESLKPNRRIFLLSNTNHVHIEWFMNALESQGLRQRFVRVFDRLYFSHEIGLRKPDPDVFYFVLNDQKIKPEDTFFIDDSPQHIKGAQELGIQTHWLEKKSSLIQVFNRYH